MYVLRLERRAHTTFRRDNKTNRKTSVKEDVKELSALWFRGGSWRQRSQLRGLTLRSPFKSYKVVKTNQMSLGKSPGIVGNGDPLQNSCLENPMDKGAWRAAVQGVARVRRN